MYRVFLVDDEEIALTQTAETVPWLDNGFMVAGTESDPVRAIERILEERPEVVFSDLRMPQMDGNELIYRVREQGFSPEFVMLSAYGNFEDARTFFKQEGFDYLLKPLRMAEVELLLENLSRRLAVKHAEDFSADIAFSEASDSFKALVEYVQKNFTRHHTLEKLGKDFGISPSYICTLFGKYFNTSLSGFVTRLRMDEAQKRIGGTGESFKSVAISCGYNDYYYFSKVFKGYYGISPAEYRKLYKK